MTESFAELFEESLLTQPMRPGTIFKAKIVQIGSDYIRVNAGLKSEGNIPIEQFLNESGELEVAVGDEVDVAFEAVEDGFGETRLSREKAKRSEAWATFKNAYESGQLSWFSHWQSERRISPLKLGAIRAFLPGSLVDVRPVRDTSFIEGKEFEFKVIKMDQKRNNIVVSRRSRWLNAEGSAEREALLAKLQEGQEVKGVVKNLTDYGAFVDLGGVDGLLHITDMSWKRVKHPSEIVTYW